MVIDTFGASAKLGYMSETLKTMTLFSLFLVQKKFIVRVSNLLGKQLNHISILLELELLTSEAHETSFFVEASSSSIGLDKIKIFSLDVFHQMYIWPNSVDMVLLIWDNKFVIVLDEVVILSINLH